MQDAMAKFINLLALQQAEIKNDPFPYLIIPNFICESHLSSLIKDFPNIAHRGSVPVQSIQATPLFQEFIQELQDIPLRQLLANKFNLDLQNKPAMLSFRGYTTERDGYIHTDSKTKLLTLLLYMNEHWTTKAGQLRLLKNRHSLEDYLEEISPLAGTCLIFKVTPNCWHGHAPFIGKRLSLQLNYLTDKTAFNKQINQHRLSSFLKRLLSNLSHYFYRDD